MASVPVMSSAHADPAKPRQDSTATIAMNDFTISLTYHRPREARHGTAAVPAAATLVPVMVSLVPAVGPGEGLGQARCTQRQPDGPGRHAPPAARVSPERRRSGQGAAGRAVH